MQRADEQRPEDPLIGFLTAVDTPAHGCLGGYLLVDGCGRPVEFHCTTPVKVSRAQQILYGSTLPGQLHGRHLGAALLGNATLNPRLVVTDLDTMLAVRTETTLPVALVATAADVSRPGAVVVGGVAIVPPPETNAGWLEPLEALARAVDLHEPFGRIRAAIDEAQRH